jgi:hypothetical protein
MKLGIVLENKESNWTLQRFLPLRESLDITAFIGENNDYEVDAQSLKRQNLTYREEYLWASRSLSEAYRRIVRAPHKQMDYYFSLKRYLQEFDIVYSCDITWSTYTLARSKDPLGFKLCLSWWENILYRAYF